MPCSKKILSCFHNDNVEVEANANVGFAKTTTIKLLNHVYDSYGTITPIKMEYTTTDIVTLYDPSKPITKLIVQIEKRVKIANAENTPFTNLQMLAKAYLLVPKTGL